MSTCNFITVIDENQCIGDSLPIINNNYGNLNSAVCELSSRVVLAPLLSRTIQAFNCERTGVGTAGTNFSFGNGSTTDGIVMPLDGRVIGATYHVTGITGTATAHLTLNGTSYSQYPLSITAPNVSDVQDYTLPPYSVTLPFYRGDRLTWKLITQPSTATGQTITFYVLFN